MIRRAVLAALAGVLVLAGCGAPIQRQPVSADDGLHLTGRIDGRHINVSVGEPEVMLGACDFHRPGEIELCIAARTVDGETFGIVLQNPEDLVEGETSTVRATCPDGGCEGVALVEIRRGEVRHQADGGELDVRRAGPRYAARFTLRLGNDVMNGAFDVDPDRPR